MGNVYTTPAIQCGSAVREAKRALNPAAFTRRQAVRVIAKTDDPEVISVFAKHMNKQVQRYVAHKLERLNDAGPVDLSRFNVRVWTAEIASELFEIMEREGIRVKDAAELCGVTERRIKTWQKKLEK